MVVGRAGNFFGVARYNFNGILDTSFSGDGLVTTDFSGTTSDEANAVAIQADGKIVVAGRAGANGFAVARYNTNGTLDTTFSGDGKVITNIGSEASANGIAIQADGKIVVVGKAAASGSSLFGVVRYNADGSLDLPFGGCCTNGIVLTNASGTGSDEAKAVAIQADGKIVVTGAPNFTLARYNTNGTLDTTFSGDGEVTTPGLGAAGAVAIQADGKIVVAGTGNAPGPSGGLAVARYNSTGGLDGTFSGDGIANATIGCFAAAHAIAIQKSNGRIVTAGSTLCIEAGTSSFALARYHAFECGGLNVTILGTDGPDTISGSGVILGLGGDDTITGSNNADTLCGGSGNDVINGRDGNDILFGGTGNDTLNGGNQTDVCVGGGQSGDTFSSCETINTGGGGFSGVWEDVSQQCNNSDQNFKCKLRGTLTVKNPGTETTAVPTLVAFYLSNDDILDENDTFLKTVEIEDLDGGETLDIKFRAKLDEGQDASGQFVIAVLDFLNAVPELNEDNNIVVSPPVQ